jgi:SAM-dependent methyltransferase
MRGDYDSKVREYRLVFEKAEILYRSGGKALDLGSGPGFQSVALADLGFEVLSVNTSETLLRELRDRTGGRVVRTVLGDMRKSGTYANEGPFEVAVCMGDTATSPTIVSRGREGVRRRVRGPRKWRHARTRIPRRDEGARRRGSLPYRPRGVTEA